MPARQPDMIFREGKTAKKRSSCRPQRRMEDITSPVVRRAVAQTIKVVNAIIREQGESPVSIHLELQRDE